MKTDDPSTTDNAALRQQARQLYFQAYRIADIAQKLGVSEFTLYSWRRRERWDSTPDAERVQACASARLAQLIDKPEKSGRDFKEIDLLGRQIARIQEKKNNSATKTRGRQKPPKNHFTEAQTDALRTNILKALYAHQRCWYQQRAQRNRCILKSRQIGASWYFAREALLDALETGHNQIFLSASRAQAFQFKRFIQRVAQDVDVELKGGDAIVLSNGASLHFLGTSAASAQSYTGNLYFDEIFWTKNFIELRKVASGNAMQTGLRRTYFSTPSGEEHDAYALWTGDLFNAGRRDGKSVAIDLSHKVLKPGSLGGDNLWRQRVTLPDAIDQGYDRFDINELMSEYSPDEFANLFMCEFVRGGESAFDYDALLRCAVDGYNKNVWPDWQPFAPRPLGDRPVWLGYDPTGSGGKGDSGGLVVLAPPQVAGGTFRVVERQQLRGLEFEQQAEAIRLMTRRYQVQFIGIDGTGAGEAVWLLVRKFFPAAQCLQYSPVLKRALVLKAQMIIRAGRLEYDSGMKDISDAFLAIRRVISPAGILTYGTGRARGVSHGDLAWATMNALYHEPIGSELGGINSFIMEF